MTLLSLSAVFLFILGCEIDDDDDTSSLRISPASASFNSISVTNIVFTASDGTPDYAWSVYDTSLGTIVAGGNTAIYSSKTKSGQNFVTVTDAQTNAFTATVIQN